MKIRPDYAIIYLSANYIINHSQANQKLSKNYVTRFLFEESLTLNVLIHLLICARKTQKKIYIHKNKYY